MITFKGIVQGDSCFHLEFSNGAIVSWSEYESSVLTWWKNSAEDELILEPMFNVTADQLVGVAIMVSTLSQPGVIE